MMTQTDAYNRGFASGKRACTGLAAKMKATYEGWQSQFPHVDVTTEVLKLDQERMASPPSLAKYPETRGWSDLVAAERKGFVDASGAGPAELAFRYTSFYFMVYRLYTRYVGGQQAPVPSPVGTSQCTAVFMRDSKEGGPLYGRNCDGGYTTSCDVRPPRRGPDGKRRLWCKGVSCWTYCDEEPQEIFPLDAWRTLPDDCRKLPEVVAFLERYVQFWWAANGVIVDEELNCVAYEKTSCRIGWRYTDDGTAAVTACAMLIPEMHAFRESCLQRALGRMGYHDNNLPDRNYWDASVARYHRLLKLVREAAQRGPTLQDMADIMTDHAVPAPHRVCLAGESPHPSIPEGGCDWTLRSRSVVLEGPNRRTLFWANEGRQPVYTKPPYLIPGEGVAIKPEWQKGTRPNPGPIGPDDELEAYRQYEFDHPDYYPA